VVDEAFVDIGSSEEAPEHLSAQPILTSKQVELRVRDGGERVVVDGRRSILS